MCVENFFQGYLLENLCVWLRFTETEAKITRVDGTTMSAWSTKVAHNGVVIHSFINPFQQGSSVVNWKETIVFFEPAVHYFLLCFKIAP